MRASLCGEVPVASRRAKKKTQKKVGEEEEVLEVCGANLIDTGAQTKRGGNSLCCLGGRRRVESGVGSQEVSEG